MSAEGDYIIGMFRPWLDMTHHNPAKPGELRHYVTDPDGKDFEVDGPELYQFPGQDKPVIPHTRTFIPAALGDAVVMCWSRGDATMLGHQYIPRDQRIGLGGRIPKTVTSKDRNRGGSGDEGDDT